MKNKINYIRKSMLKYPDKENQNIRYVTFYGLIGTDEILKLWNLKGKDSLEFQSEDCLNEIIRFIKKHLFPTEFKIILTEKKGFKFIDKNQKYNLKDTEHLITSENYGMMLDYTDILELEQKLLLEKQITW